MTWAAISLEALIGKVHVGTPICSHFWRSHPTTSPTRQRWYPFCSLVVFEASAVRIFNATYSPSISVCWTSEIVELVPYPSLLTTTYLSLWNFVSDVRRMITPGTVMVYILDFVWIIEPGPWRWYARMVENQHYMYVHTLQACAVVWHHGLLDPIVKNRGSVFTLKFWSSLCYS